MALTTDTNADAAELRFRHEPKLVEDRCFVATHDGSVREIAYGRRIEAFRALGRLMANPESEALSESCEFEMLSLQLESSRNGVITPDNIKAFIRRAALMGINTLMLYLEDTYEVPGEPFFGYLRGGFSQNELKNLDEYAELYGIEMVPCIQALGHLKQVLQWDCAYEAVTDIPDVLLANEPKTYKLLGKIIDAAKAPFRSNRIHLGMDEAVGMGTGNFKARFGERDLFEIMNEHLNLVAEICAEKDLKPMIWSDMYFRLGSKTHQYYDLDGKIPPSAYQRIPENVDLVYWDYYHLDQDFYETYIDRHREMNKEPIVALGAWNWDHFWTNIPYSLARILPGMEACKAKNVREVFMTTWGDDGMECDIYSVLPVIQAFADVAYNGTYDEAQTARNFNASCLANFSDYTLASQLDQTAPNKNSATDYSNCSKWLMWDDPLIGLCQPMQEIDSYRAGYQKLADQLKTAIEKKNPGAARLRFPAQIATVLALKCDCRKNLVDAYQASDKDELLYLAATEVTTLLFELTKLWKLHRALWLDTYKPFGLEVIEIRYGGQLTRLQSLIDRVNDYCSGCVMSIPEFETELIAWNTDRQAIGGYRRIATPSAIF
ncbi:MAG: beta-N-acetylhexosaminidase [Lentimonas sp.]